MTRYGSYMDPRGTTRVPKGPDSNLGPTFDLVVIPEGPAREQNGSNLGQVGPAKIHDGSKRNQAGSKLGPILTLR